METLIIFTILSIINVITSTIRSIVTVKGGKWSSSLISAGYFAFYNVMLIYTVAEFPLWQKIVVTFGCNLVGVFVVKLIEEKARKDKLWQLSITVPIKYTSALHHDYKTINLPHNFVEAGKWSVFTVYCEQQKDTLAAVDIAKQYGAKMFATENKLSL
jgi:uncharacterized protein YebE (UPF0316 family)